ncbi:pro-resilin-like [Palaemon carinicauda]|uniref:pro-resilin-like n=1 Tax=Palaemon carinicauda TaxID=392227 RepID=UPI0035B69B87
MACKLVLLACVAAVGLSAPQQQGYGYQPPQQPTSLYQTPTGSTRPPTRPPPPPPQPPTQLYNTPGPKPSSTNIRPNTYSPPPTGQMEGMPYDFTWGVEDQNSGNSFSHVENSDGRTTQGEYRVLLPDGRTQVVTFYDNGDGFNAEVTYI